MSTYPDRRTVVSGAAAIALAGAASAGPARAAQKPLRVGVVGAGWFGKLDSQALMQVAPVDFVAYADVDRRMLDEAKNEALNLPRAVQPLAAEPAIFADWREMLDRHAFDIVLIDTPDHWHALPTVAALEAGAHVYLQKPTSVDIREGEAMIAAAKNSGRIVQVGVQRRTAPHFIEAKREIVEAGLLGEVGHVEIFGYFHQRPQHFDAPTAPPAHLDWDAYCGPAPLLDYRPGLHPTNWRAFEEFGNGFIGDIGVHFIDAMRWMLELGWPRRISSAGGAFVHQESVATAPDTQIATFEFDGLVMTWMNRVWGRASEPDFPWGAAIHGEKGTLRISTDDYEFLPANGDGARRGAVWLDTDQFPHESGLEHWRAVLNTYNRTHMRDFLRAIETGSAPAAPIEEGHASTACCILANMSRRLGRSLEWDVASARPVGDAEAEELLARPYRAPWRHPINANRSP